MFRASFVRSTIGASRRALLSETTRSTARRMLATRVGSSSSTWAAPRNLRLLFGVGSATVATYLAADEVHCGWFSRGTDWEAVRKDIEKIIDDNEAGPVFVRLAWHCAGTYDKATNTGGSNGATMRFSPEAGHGANAGLKIARDLLEPVKAKYPDVSYADLYTFAGAAAVEYMGGPKIPWKGGRSDAPDGGACPPDGRLPNAALGFEHVRAIFYRMGFNDREIVALIGAHTLGKCHKDRSGYDGPWTRDPNGFDNTFYTLLLSEKWQVKKGSNPPQFENADGKDLMMLPADMAFLVDPVFREYIELYARDSEAWFKDFAAAFGKLLELGVPRK